ncbi:MAG: hypothetical protein CMQ28_04650 [Gammaproteobacteria bacterium]|nr:hypothetical protein [Gammaproteobacteria bacterium]|tara:strand:+ start:2598 stop:3338 length:741 start_codon:yes stop_codon:yes gene_type:complete
MKIGLQQIIISIVALLVAIIVVVFIYENPARLGEQPLIIRALVLSLAIIAALVAVYPLNPMFADRPGTYVGIVCIPALIPGFVFYMLLLPGKAGEGFEAEQLASSLISDRSSNGIIEVGFRYPIYTPTISVKNRELFTRHVNVFLRMIDSNGGDTLFRAVRLNVPGNSLSVESTVQGMLSENRRYLFNPLEIPPDRSLEGQVVFVISNLEDGTTFTDALVSAYQAQFEIRDPENGQLLLEFPLQHI